jgi:hypothetical protein
MRKKIAIGIGAALILLGIAFAYPKEKKLVLPDSFSNAFLAQNTYYGPITPIPGNPQLVRVQVLVRDSPASGGVQIESAEFNGQGIPLKPRDIYGNRGGASFQVPPGKYKLRWRVKVDKQTWPRATEHVEEVNVDPRDFWIQITIVGDEASIR